MAMAQEQGFDADDDLGPAGGPLGGLRRSRRLPSGRIALFAAIPVVIALGLGGAWYAGFFSPATNAGPAAESGAVFFDLPDILVNLSVQNGRASYLKLKVSLELADPEAPKTIEKLAPRVVDNLQVYLRELRLSDLDGSAGMFRLKEELLARVNAAVAPVEVRDVLFREMLVQ